ncbi:hypothetical protein D3C72_695340 [compost metagenome]
MCQIDRVKEARLGAQQVQKDRQQTVALAIDDDTQLQIKPLMPSLFFDLGIPMFNRLHIEMKAGTHLHFPVRGAQRRKPFVHKPEPGGIIRQREHLAGTIQRTLARGFLEAELLQDLTQFLFHRRLALNALGFGTVEDHYFRVAIHRRLAVVGKHQGGAVLKNVFPARALPTADEGELRLR